MSGKKIRKTVLCAVFAACAAVVLLLSGVLPTGQLGFAAAASLFVAAAVTEGGFGAGLSTYAVSAVLGYLLCPDKAPALLYILFFGYYPAVKAAAERLPRRAAGWCVKLPVLNAALAVILFAVGLRVPGLRTGGWMTALTWLGANLVFVLFDVGMTRLTAYYAARLSPRLNR